MVTTIAAVADFWGTSRRRGVGDRFRNGLRTTDPRPHYVVCGQDVLAYQLVNELLSADSVGDEAGVPGASANGESGGSSVRVTVIASRELPRDGPDIRKIRGIRLVYSDRLDEETFRLAGLAGAAGLALMSQDDVGNIHAALCAQAVEPNVRLVMRLFNTRFRAGIRQLFPHCAVLSDASMAAPAFVAAALGEVAPTYFRHNGRTLYLARRPDVRPEQVVCGLADTDDPNRTGVLPGAEDRADLVLAEATGEPARHPDGTQIAARRLARARRWRRRPAVLLVRAVRSFATRKIGMATLSVLGVVASLGVLLSMVEDTTPGQSLYLTLITTLSGADPDPEKSVRGQVMQVVLTLAGLALVPLITATVVDGLVNARLALDTARMHPEREGHVVVVGLGDVGTRVMAQLNDLGVEVVAIDKNPDARGAPVARRLNIPLIVGDAALDETLELASISKCHALVVVTTDDVSNLQAALNARALNGELRVVLRVFDGDFAERIQQAFSIGISHSVPYLAAPSFSAALLNRAVVATLPIDRDVLLVAEVVVAPGSALIGRPVDNLTRSGESRVIALVRSGQHRPTWSPSGEERLAAGDRLTVVVRRAVLGRLLKQAAAAVEPGPGPIEASVPRARIARTPPALRRGRRSLPLTRRGRPAGRPYPPHPRSDPSGTDPPAG
jgi:Trk K+ transport system NAD-binding subunit